MIEDLFEKLNLQGIWESIISQVSSLFDPERFQFLGALGFFWDKILDNPLASIITLLALIGLPYTLLKAKESSNQANARLDRLMEEMKDFEFEKPLIDLQENSQDTSIGNSTTTGYEQNVFEMNSEYGTSGLSIEQDSALQDLEATSFEKQLILNQEVTDDFLATESMDLQPETGYENPEFSPLAEEDSNETDISQPVKFNVEEENYANLYIEDLQIEDETLDLVSAIENNIDETEVTSPESIVEDKDFANHDRDDLQTKMEKAIKNLRTKYPSKQETQEVASGEINATPAPLVAEKVEKPSLNHEIKKNDNSNISHPSSEMPYQEEDTAHPPTASIPTDSLAKKQENSLKKSHLITHLKSFQNNLENQFDSKTPE